MAKLEARPESSSARREGNVVCDVEGGKNLLVCFMFIQSDKGVDIDIQEVCG
jgi:hypothetical protein